MRTVTRGWSVGSGHSAKSSPVPLSSSRTQQASSQVTTAMATSCVGQRSHARPADGGQSSPIERPRSTLGVERRTNATSRCCGCCLHLPCSELQLPGTAMCMTQGTATHLVPIVDVPQLSSVPDGAGRRQSRVDIPAARARQELDTVVAEGEGEGLRLRTRCSPAASAAARHAPLLTLKGCQFRMLVLLRSGRCHGDATMCAIAILVQVLPQLALVVSSTDRLPHRSNEVRCPDTTNVPQTIALILQLCWQRTAAVAVLTVLAARAVA